jgi:hypothetical protein
VNKTNSSAFREFSWRFVNIILQARVSLGHRPNYELVCRDVNNIEPLFYEYCKKWLVPKYQNFDQMILNRANKVNEHNLSMAMKGRELKTVALLQFISESNEYDPVADGLMTAVKYDKTYFDKIVSSVGPMLEKFINEPEVNRQGF